MEPIKRLWPKPDNLTGYGLDFYKRVGRQLVAVGVLTELDRESFRSLAASYHVMLQAESGILEHGATVKGSQDEVKKNPSFTTYKMASDIFNRLARRFYLTPLDRAGVELQPPKKTNGKDKFFT